MELINSIRTSEDNWMDNRMVNMTIKSNKGTKENVYCSNHGYCDFTNGHCKCAQATSLHYSYKWQSSNGYGFRGNRGDCGYQRDKSTTCPVKGVEIGISPPVTCSGRGRCDNTTYVGHTSPPTTHHTTQNTSPTPPQ